MREYHYENVTFLNALTGITDEAGIRFASYSYDVNGKAVLSEHAGNTDEYNISYSSNTSTVTNPLGKDTVYYFENIQGVRQVVQVDGVASPNCVASIRDSGSTLRYTHDRVFDELSRLIESVGASAQTSTYAYDKNSNLTAQVDANNNATAYAYDGLQRFISSTDALAGMTELDYDGLDNLTAVEDQRNNTTAYTYNAFGDILTESSPDRGLTTYIVDKAGNITKRTDARGVVTDYTWDALNRLLTVAYPSAGSLDATLTYDSPTGCGTAPVGQLCSVADAAGTTTYQYNVLGHLTNVSEARTGGPTLATAYTYDLAGTLAGITLPSGRTISYSSNSNGLVSGVTATVAGSPVNLASSVTYLPFGPVTGLTYGNSRTFTATYDQDYNPTNRAVSTIYNHAYDTDPNGNIIEIGATDYGYDALNRLDEENPGSATTYTYDATSNRLTKVSGGTTTTTVPAGSNRISAVGGTGISYNSAGAVIASGTTTYNWNAAGQLATVQFSSSTVGTYTYDSQNRRTKKVAGGNTTQYVYGQGGLLYGEYTNAGVLIREYVYLNGQPLAQIDAGSPEVLTYLHPDHLGTPKYGTNTGGTQVWAANTDAFGVGTPSGSRTVNLRMPGQYYDSESTLFYNWNRYYNPATGRYITPDPIGIEGGLNTFLYVEANPVMYVDPEGKLWFAPALAAAAIDVLTPIAICAVTPGCKDYVGNTIQNTGKWIQQETERFIKWCADLISPNKTPEDLLGDSDSIDTQGKITQGIKSGGQSQADKDFNDLVGTTSRPTNTPGVRTGKTKDGRPVNIYPESQTSGGPTIEIINPDGTRIKLRY